LEGVLDATQDAAVVELHHVIMVMRRMPKLPYHGQSGCRAVISVPHPRAVAVVKFEAGDLGLLWWKVFDDPRFYFSCGSEVGAASGTVVYNERDNLVWFWGSSGCVVMSG